jgi:hypothetical protein
MQAKAREPSNQLYVTVATKPCARRPICCRTSLEGGVSVRLAEFVPRLDRLGCGSERAGHYLAVRQDDVLPSVDVVAM